MIGFQYKQNILTGSLPNLIVIGAQKAGTTSLHFYLKQHPQIFMSSLKELDFFVEELKLQNGMEWYRKQFRSSLPIRGESSPTYTHYPFFKGVPKRIHNVVPDAKLIYLLRDPVERMISSYTHKLSMGSEERSFEEAVFSRECNNNYVYFSQYFLQLKQYLSVFDENQILIVSSEELDSSRTVTMSNIFRFLEVDETFQCEKFDHRLNQSREKRIKTAFGKRLAKTPLMERIHNLPRKIRRRIEEPLYYPFSIPVVRPIPTDLTRERICALLKGDADELRKYTGKKFSEWSL